MYVGYPLSARTRFVRRISRVSARSGSTVRPKSSVRSRPKSKSKSKTTTLTKPKSIYTPIRNDGPMSNSFFHWPRRASSLRLGILKKTMTPQFYIQNAYSRLEAGVGVQAVPIAPAYPMLWSPSDLLGMFTQARISSTTTAPTNNTVINPATQNILLKSCTSELMITNQTNDVVHLTLYECVARKDTYNGNYYNPGVAWSQGTFDQGNTTAYLMVGSNPFQTPAFTKFYRVERVIDINLHTGGHHVHRSKSTMNHLMNYEEYQAATSSGTIRGVSRFTLPVIHGYPSNDSTTHSQISTTAVAIDMVWKKQYQYYVFDRSTVGFSVSNVLPTSYTVGGEIINDLTGVATGSVIA